MAASRAVFVTGASTGIGEAVARRLDQLGYDVFATVRRPDDGERLAAGSSSRLRWLQVDVTREEDVAMAARRVADEAGGLFALVNNAGIAVGGPLEFVPIAEFRRQLEVNVVALLAVTQAMLPLLRRSRGRVVNIGSISGRTAAPFVGPYSASKHAVEAMSDALRLEVANAGIQVSLIEPGPVKTPIWSKGIEAATQARQTFPPQALELYGRQFRLFERLLAMNESRADSADHVADAVVDALESERPRTRYVVGTEAKIRIWLSRLLPDRWNDGLLRLILDRLERRTV